MNSRAPEVAESTLTDGYYCEVPNDPCVVVMFGASGDLARRKLLPALFDLARHACLAPRFRLLGFARTQMSDDEFRGTAGEALAKDGKASRDEDKRLEFLKQLHYFSGNYDDPEAYVRLTRRLDELDRAGQLAGNRLFYLATPPDVYPRIIEQLGRAGLAQPKGGESWTRVIIEKPFGHDRASARELNRTVLGVFNESQVYRIDHYLGKETVQNLLVFRFGNGIFEPLWNRNYVDHVQITASESLGVENRAAFYESAGALRDMIQSHMLQLTSLVALEGPATFDATAVRNEKIKVLQSIRPFTRETIWKSVVRGQYGPGTVGGKAVPGYRQEHGVRPDSATDTFVALKLQVDNWRWSGVPFYLRTGKRLAKPRTEVAIQFKKAPHMVFRGGEIEPNSLILYIQPDEGISLSFGAKLPGGQMQIRPVTMDFQYRTAFGGGSRDAYATLINDCIRGDATLFDRADSVEEAWGLVDPILEAWKSASAPPFPNYPAGSEGPRAADDLTLTEGRRWRPL
ncbi:MAG TPA: glucose-6-phosphate dehydrogenase [Verrucomicrobiae bacterium]|jgi:glucose-6-phosphate 1-dehydrogenase|nr:glucose-6-phosphate dehydrogenase [Verrucomicrobiae bacterium]